DRLGAELIHHEHLPDQREPMALAVGAQGDADLILLCGGISKGKRDFVRPVVESLHGAPAFHGVAQRPGKPLAFWPGPPPIFALPGNPMSVLVCFHRYVCPFLQAMQQ
ncbi:MAG: molybdopterin molybdenumtransferase MoeA, partial [Akkermansiaceae bacterium]|nr:molybdopterin molybdenumtransferase MoeA [Akkermansiaceae bacterium]